MNKSKNVFICPICGESRILSDCIENNDYNHGIIRIGIPKTKYKGIFKKRKYRIDTYRCITCGSTWDSEPYIDE